MNRIARTAILLAALVLGLAACSGAGTSTADPGAGTSTAEPGETAETTEAAETSGGAAVTVQGFRFDPPELTVAVGDTVTWTNADGIDHTATSGTPEDPDGTFAVDMPESGASGQHTFAEAGTYAYFCEIHESMRGEIAVE